MSAPAPDDQWIRDHYERVHRAAWLLTGDVWSADDLTQETFIRALTRWRQFDGRAEESTWLYAILLNLHRSQRRSLHRAAQRLRRWWERRDDAGVDTNDPRALLAEKTWRQSVWSQVSKLPAPQQHAIFLRFGEGLSFDQIAELQGCATGTAQTRVHYGLKKLKSNLSAEDWAEADLGLPLLRKVGTARTT